jgi:hypothetical protein
MTATPERNNHNIERRARHLELMVRQEKLGRLTQLTRLQVICVHADFTRIIGFAPPRGRDGYIRNSLR